MKNYELTVVFHPDLEMNLDPAIDKVKKIIESAGGEIIKEDNEGKKRLAYSVNGQEFGIYNFITVALPPEGPAKIDGVLNITDEVIRHMLVREDRRRPIIEAESATSEESDKPKEESTSTEEKGE